MRVGLGWSTRGSEAIALREALAQAAGKSGEPRFAFLFATPQYNPHRVWEAFREFVPSGRVLGCSAEGVIVEERCLSLGLVVLTLGGEDVEAWTIAPALHSRDPYTLGEAIGRAVRKSSLAEGTLFILSDPSLEVPLLLQGVYNLLGPRFLYLGGGTGAFRWTEEGVNRGPVSVGVLGGVEFSSAADHGWSPTRELLVVTKAREREVVEIDGVSPFESYRARVGDFSREDLPRIGSLYPLGFPNICGDFLIRDPAYFTSSGAMGFVGARVSPGAVGYIMKGEKESLLAAAASAAEKAAGGIEEPAFALLFDCVSRPLFLGDDFDQEIRQIKRGLGRVPVCGFLSTGEIHPYGRAPLFRNKNVVAAVGGKGRKEVAHSDACLGSLEAELAVLHEVAALSFPESYEVFFVQLVERVVRLFGAQRMALSFGGENRLTPVASWGFSSPEEVKEVVEHPQANHHVALLGEEKILVLEAPGAISIRERRLYTIFAQKVREVLRLARRAAEKDEKLQKLEHLSLTDELTGLYNRRGFFVLAERELSLTEQGKKAGVLVVDLDNLKWINDHLGHGEGDRALREFGSILRRAFRQSDIVARLGGDEFAVFFAGVGESDIEKLLERLENLVTAWNRESRCPYRLFFSAGWAFLDPSEPQSLRELLAAADQNMYLEKRRKKGR